MEYVCEGCEYRTTHESNYKKHLETKKHKALKKDPFVCKYCDKGFNFRQSMYRHMKYTCKKKNEPKDDINDLMQLIKEERDKREALQKQIEQLSEKLDQTLKT